MIIYNLLEQRPAARFIEVAKRPQVGLMARIPHSSGCWKASTTKDTKFDASDHRAPARSRLAGTGLQKVEQLKFITRARAAAWPKAAIQYILATPELTASCPISTMKSNWKSSPPHPNPAFTAEDWPGRCLFDSNYGLPVDTSMAKVP